MLQAGWLSLAPWGRVFSIFHPLWSQSRLRSACLQFQGPAPLCLVDVVSGRERAVAPEGGMSGEACLPGVCGARCLHEPHMRGHVRADSHEDRRMACTCARCSHTEIEHGDRTRRWCPPCDLSVCASPVRFPHAPSPAGCLRGCHRTTDTACSPSRLLSPLCTAAAHSRPARVPI